MAATVTAKYVGNGSSTTPSGIWSWEYEFKNIGYKVDATEIIKLEVIAIDSQVDVEGFIQCIQIADGVSPRLP